MLRPGESRLNGIPNALVVNELVVRANGATNGKVVVIRNNLTTITLDRVALVVNEVQVSNAHGVENPAVAGIDNGFNLRQLVPSHLDANLNVPRLNVVCHILFLFWFLFSVLFGVVPMFKE